MLDFSEKQRRIIRRAILAGRKVISKQGPSVLRFERAFIRSRGIQIPAIELSIPIHKLIASHIVASLDTGRMSFSDNDIFNTVIRREVNRAHAESYLASNLNHRNVIGFRPVIPETLKEKDCCQEMAEQDFGLGPGIWPKEEIAVLPPCCDGVYFEIITASPNSVH